MSQELLDAAGRPRSPATLPRFTPGARRANKGRDERPGEQLRPWLDARAELRVGPLVCIVTGPTRGRAGSNTAVRAQLRHVAAQAGLP